MMNHGVISPPSLNLILNAADPHGSNAAGAGRRPERPTIKSRDAHSGGGLRGRLGQSPQRVEYGVDGSYVVDGGDRADLLGARGHSDLGF